MEQKPEPRSQCQIRSPLTSDQNMIKLFTVHDILHVSQHFSQLTILEHVGLWVSGEVGVV